MKLVILKLMVFASLIFLISVPLSAREDSRGEKPSSINSRNRSSSRGLEGRSNFKSSYRDSSRNLKSSGSGRSLIDISGSSSKSQSSYPANSRSVNRNRTSSQDFNRNSRYSGDKYSNRSGNSLRFGSDRKDSSKDYDSRYYKSGRSLVDERDSYSRSSKYNRSKKDKKGKKPYSVDRDRDDNYRSYRKKHDKKKYRKKHYYNSYYRKPYYYGNYYSDSYYYAPSDYLCYNNGGLSIGYSNDDFSISLSTDPWYYGSSYNYRSTSYRTWISGYWTTEYDRVKYYDRYGRISWRTERRNVWIPGYWETRYR